MKLIKLLLIILIVPFSFLGQTTPPKKEKFPSYFGLQVRPILPTRFIGEPEKTLINKEFSTTITQKVGYSFGGTVRAGLTKLLAFESGINFTQRNFDISMSVADSNVHAKNDLNFVTYEIPVNGLVYIRLGEQFFMNTSMGAAICYKPTHVGIVTLPGGSYTFNHTGFVASKIGLDINVNVGFEFRTEKKGFFYIGGSGSVPLKPMFQLYAEYKYQGYSNKVNGPVDGTFLAIDFKYFFPNISNKGPQFQEGPIK